MKLIKIFSYQLLSKNHSVIMSTVLPSIYRIVKSFRDLLIPITRPYVIKTEYIPPSPYFRHFKISSTSIRHISRHTKLFRIVFSH